MRGSHGSARSLTDALFIVFFCIISLKFVKFLHEFDLEFSFLLKSLNVVRVQKSPLYALKQGIDYSC
jgi:hypothetical protein